MARQIPERAVLSFAVVCAPPDKVGQRRTDVLAPKPAQADKAPVQGTLLGAEEISGRQEPPPVALIAIRGAGPVRVIPAGRVYVRLMDQVVRRPVGAGVAVRRQEAKDKVSKLIASPSAVVGRAVAEADKAARPVAQAMAQNAEGGYEIAEGAVSCDRAPLRAGSAAGAGGGAGLWQAVGRAFGHPPMGRRLKRPLRQALIADVEVARLRHAVKEVSALNTVSARCRPLLVVLPS